MTDYNGVEIKEGDVLKERWKGGRKFIVEKNDIKTINCQYIGRSIDNWIIEEKNFKELRVVLTACENPTKSK